MTSTHRTAPSAADGASVSSPNRQPLPALVAAGLAALAAVTAATLAFTVAAVWRSLRTRQHAEPGADDV